MFCYLCDQDVEKVFYNKACGAIRSCSSSKESQEPGIPILGPDSGRLFGFRDKVTKEALNYFIFLPNGSNCAVEESNSICEPV